MHLVLGIAACMLALIEERLLVARKRAAGTSDP